jgi:DNA-binding response OmpR family regulator
MHVLLVEDDPLVRDGVANGLRMHGFEVTPVGHASSAQSVRRSSHIDICVLDFGLPDIDGIHLLRQWRAEGVGFPVVALTARDSVKFKVMGLQAGADDYLTKPFDLDELVARMQSVLRRSTGAVVNRYRWGPLTLMPETGEVHCHGASIELTRREFGLLQAFLQYPHQILTASQLQDSIYGLETNVESNAVNVHIHHLRRKLGPKTIETVRGIGFRLGPAEAFA